MHFKRIFKSLSIMHFISITTIGFASENTEAIREALESRNQAVHIFSDWMRDPYIMIGPDALYYLTCTQFDNTAKGSGAVVYRSPDLVTWKNLGVRYQLEMASNFDAYKEKQKNADKPWHKGTMKLWAPELYYLDNRWIMVHTSNLGFGNCVITDTDSFIAPFTDWGGAFGRRHDPSIFTDDDGSHWLVYAATDIIKIKPDWSGFEGEEIKTWPSDRKIGHEGSQMIKIGGKYVLFGTGWSTDTMRHGTYNLYYCTADKVTGPYDERKFVGRCLGHGTVFKDKNDQWWCTAFYNANVPAVEPDRINTLDVSDTAYTMNKQGLTLVPIDIQLVNGEVVIKTLDKNYAMPGKEEVQKFD